MGKALRYHSGSLALGSLFLTLLIPVKMIFYFIGVSKGYKLKADYILA